MAVQGLQSCVTIERRSWMMQIDIESCEHDQCRDDCQDGEPEQCPGYKADGRSEPLLGPRCWCVRFHSINCYG